MPNEVDVQADAVELAPRPVDRDQGSDLSWPLFGALLATVAVEAGLAAAVAAMDTRYGQGAGHILGVGLWIAVALVNAFAFWNVAWRHHRWFANVLLAQVAALAMAVYVLWVDYQSPTPNAALRWVAAAVVAAALFWLVILIYKAPSVSGHSFGTGWKVVSAAFALTSIFSLWLTTSYLPSTQRPMVDLTTSLTMEPNPTAATTSLRADITLHNRGQANAVIVGSLYRVTYAPVADRLPLTGPASPAEAFSGPLANADLAQPARSVTTADDDLAQAFDFTTPNNNDFTGPVPDVDYGSANPPYVGLIKADEITPMREFLLPGQTWSTEVAFDMPTADVSTVRLTAQIALITSRYLGDTRACDGTVNQLSPNFLSQAHRVHVAAVPTSNTSTTTSPLSGAAASSTTVPQGVTTPYLGPPPSLDYMCVQTTLLPQSAVQKLAGEDLSIRSYYVLGDHRYSSVPVPFMITTFQSGQPPPSLAGQVKQAQAIDAQDPSAVIQSQSEYDLPGTATYGSLGQG